jgi:hypothetical protein
MEQFAVAAAEAAGWSLWIQVAALCEAAGVFAWQDAQLLVAAAPEWQTAQDARLAAAARGCPVAATQVELCVYGFCSVWQSMHWFWLWQVAQVWLSVRAAREWAWRTQPATWVFGASRWWQEAQSLPRAAVWQRAQVPFFCVSLSPLPWVSIQLTVWLTGGPTFLSLWQAMQLLLVGSISSPWEPTLS